MLKIPLLELLIKCHKRTDRFFHWIKSFKSPKFHYLNFRSSENIKIIGSNKNIKKLINKTFDQVTKNAFDLTPNLTETFDQLKRSSEI
jgi:hypothetical protein